MADQTPSRRRTAVLAVAGAGLVAVVVMGWFLLTDRQAEGPSVMAAATVTTLTEDTLAVQPPAETTAPTTAAPATTTTTAAPAVTTTLAPAATTTTAALAAASALAPAEELEEAAVPVTTATPAVVATTVAVTSTSVVGLVEFETVVPVATTAAPAAVGEPAVLAASGEGSAGGGSDVVVAGGRVFVRPSEDTVDCKGNFRRGYRVRDACVMEAVTRTWTLAWAGAREDLLSVVWYGHLLEDTLAQRMEWEQTDVALADLEQQGFSPARRAFVEARIADSSSDLTTVEVHGGHWHAPDNIGVRMRVLYDGQVVIPWIALGIDYLDGRWQLNYRAGCVLITTDSNPAGASCPPDPRPDWKPEVRDGAVLGSMYSPVDDRENRV